MPECCGCNVFKAMVNLSATASLLFFGLTVVLMFSMIQHSLVLFVMSVLYCVETLLFFKYYIDIQCMFRYRFRWHANRVWVPLADLCTVIIAASLSFNLIEWTQEDSLAGQFEMLEIGQQLAVVAVAVGLLFKLLASVLMTLLHVRLIKLQPTDTQSTSMETYPYKASAPSYFDTDSPL